MAKIESETRAKYTILASAAVSDLTELVKQAVDELVDLQREHQELNGKSLTLVIEVMIKQTA